MTFYLIQSGDSCIMSLKTNDTTIKIFSSSLICFFEYDELCHVQYTNCTQHLLHNRKYSGEFWCTETYYAEVNYLELSKQNN